MKFFAAVNAYGIGLHQMRMYWVYGPNRQDITIIGLEPHPEDKKNGAYDKVSLSDMLLSLYYRQTAPISQMHFKCLFYSEHDIYYPIKLPCPLALIVKFYIILFYADSTCLALWQFAPI